MKRAVIFGTFDCLHKGHRYFLEFSRQHADHLTAVVAPDSVVTLRKGRPPVQPLVERMRVLKEVGSIDAVVAGDREEGEWSVFQNAVVDSCIVGYDQIALLEALKRHTTQQGLAVEFITADAFEPFRFASSLMRSPTYA